MHHDSKFYNVVEFYRKDSIRPFARLNGLFAIPREGEMVSISIVVGRVISVTWNLDYLGREDEQWRCNITIDEREYDEAKGARDGG